MGKSKSNSKWPCENDYNHSGKDASYYRGIKFGCLNPRVNNDDTPGRAGAAIKGYRTARLTLSTLLID